MLLPKFLSRKISPEKSLDFFVSKISRATGVSETNLLIKRHILSHANFRSYASVHPQFDRVKLPPGGVSLLGGSQKQKIKNLEEEEPPFKHPKSIHFGGCSSGGLLFLRVLGLESTQQRNSLGGGGFSQSNVSLIIERKISCQ